MKDTVVPDEDRHQSQRACRFRGDDEFQNEAGEPDDPADLRSGQRVLHGAPLHEGDLPVGEHRKNRRDEHHAHAADLNQKEDDQLAEEAPGGRRVADNETGHADGRGGGEKGGHRAGRPSVTGGGGQHQQQGAREDQAEKAEYDDLKTVQLDTLLFHDFRHSAR